ncbi:MAG: hypothetical protein WB770_03280 [Acidimicrobiales bacterium]
MTTHTALDGATGEQGAVARKLPPVAEIAVASMAMIVAGGIYIAAHIPRHAPIGLPLGLLIAAGALLVFDVFTVSRLRSFAWDSFFLVGRWAALAYALIGGMLEFIFVFDHTRGSTLALVTLSLFVFSADVALLLAFSVARYQSPSKT